MYGEWKQHKSLIDEGRIPKQERDVKREKFTGELIKVWTEEEK